MNFLISDGTEMDKQSIPVLNLDNYRPPSEKGFGYIALHGSLDLVKQSRPKGSGAYNEINKIHDPIIYFSDNVEVLQNLFIIYPLEAIGYEESVKSPYLDMLNIFKKAFDDENVIFIIGYSLRDPTIGSILEEIIVNKIRKGDLKPLSDDLEKRKTQAQENTFKLIVFTTDAKKLKERLENQGMVNLSSTFIPIECRFPTIFNFENPKELNPNFKLEYSKLLNKVVEDLLIIQHLREDHFKPKFIDEFNKRYGIILLK
jgi:hypothetical protein